MKKYRFGFLIAVIVVGLLAFVSIVPAFAAGGEGDDGGLSGSSGCGNRHAVCTSDGAYWQYYTLSGGSVSPANSDTHVNGDGSVSISNSRVYGSVTFHGGTIDSVCASVGGYWRRSMVDHGYENGGHSIGVGDGLTYTQVGLDTNHTARGILNSSGQISSMSLNQVQEAYARWADYAARANIPIAGSINSISWFCYSDDMGCPPTDPYYPTCTPPVPEGCPIPGFTAPATGTKDSGTTATASGIISNVFTTYSGLIYVKPTDRISWAHCYYPEAQTVRYTDEEDSHPSDTSYATDVPTRTATSAVGPQDGIVASSNTASFSTTNTGFFSPDVGFTLSNSNFTLSGSTITGTLGSNNSVVVYSKTQPISYTIRTGHAGGTTTQSISTQVGTNSVSEHSGWTWTYTYKKTNGCVDVAGHWSTDDTTDPNRTWIDATYKDCDQTGTGTGTHTGNNFFAISGTTSAGGTSATAYIPYNFNTSVGTYIAQNDTASYGNEVVMANQTASVTSTVNVIQRYNGTTQGAYATEVPNAKVTVVSFYLKEGQGIPGGNSSSSSDPCAYYNGQGVYNCSNLRADTGLTLNPSAEMVGFTHTYNNTARVQNVPAGSLFCTAVGVYPANSGNDTNSYPNIAVSDKWNISTPTCRTVAKAPSTQVWGGSLATAGTVKTSATTKPKTSRTYGSWVEYAIVTTGGSGKVYGMGSGASLGYVSSYASNPNTGGSTTAAFYTRVPLTVPNKNCNSSSCTAITTSSGITVDSTLIQRLVNRFAADGASTPTSGQLVSGTVDLSRPANYKVTGGFRYTVAASGTTITASSELVPGATHIIYARGNLTISSNLIINKDNRGAGYQSLGQIPNYVIIAAGNINIEPSVTQIDAWLISSAGTLDTCTAGTPTSASSSVTSDTICHNPLRINGVVSVKKANLDRTAGAGAQDSTGSYSNKNGAHYYSDYYGANAAETFNLSLSSYLWAYAQSNRNPQAYTVYTRQLAPRL